MPIYRGNTELSNVYLGATELSQVYLRQQELLSAGVVFIDFEGQTAAPAEVVTQSSSVTALFETTGLRMFGDGGTYPVVYNGAYTGDFLVQASFRRNDNCSDHGIAIWPIANGISSARWNWGPNSGRIATQCNCPTPHIYGLTLQSNNGTVGQNIDYTYNFYHQPSINRTQITITQAKDDWDRAGTVVSSTTIAETYGADVPLYIGLSADADGTGSVWARWYNLRITQL